MDRGLCCCEHKLGLLVLPWDFSGQLDGICVGLVGGAEFDHTYLVGNFTIIPAESTSSSLAGACLVLLDRDKCHASHLLVLQARAVALAVADVPVTAAEVRCGTSCREIEIVLRREALLLRRLATLPRSLLYVHLRFPLICAHAHQDGCCVYLYYFCGF